MDAISKFQFRFFFGILSVGWSGCLHSSHLLAQKLPDQDNSGPCPLAVAAAESQDSILPRQNTGRYPQDIVEALSRLPKGGRTLVVVDGLSSGADYPVRFRELFGSGNLIHLQSSERMAPAVRDTFNPNHYDVNLIYDPNTYPHLLELLSPFKEGVFGIAAGTETAPQLRMELSKDLGLPASSLNDFSALTDKKKAARAVGPYVKTISGEAFSSSSMAWDWVLKNRLAFPLFIKPVSGAASFGSRVIRSKADFDSHFSETLGVEDPLGQVTSHLLVQPYFSVQNYTEHVIDVVVDPEVGPVVANILRYSKKEEDGFVKYLHTRLLHLDPGSQKFRAFKHFAEGVVRGLDYPSGVLHIEMFVNNDNPDDIVFIEPNPRPAGGGLPLLVRKCGGVDMITLHLYSIFDRSRFNEAISKGPQFAHHGIQVDLLGPSTEAIVVAVPTLDEFKATIPGFSSHSLHLSPGGRVRPSSHLLSGPGAIDVIGTKEVVDQADAVIRQWEEDGFYRTRPVSDSKRDLFGPEPHPEH